jgi:hypothetical protein
MTTRAYHQVVLAAVLHRFRKRYEPDPTAFGMVCLSTSGAFEDIVRATESQRGDRGGKAISSDRRIAPGTDYKLDLVPEFVEAEADCNRLESAMVCVGEVMKFSSRDSEIDEWQPVEAVEFDE